MAKETIEWLEKKKTHRYKSNVGAQKDNAVEGKEWLVRAVVDKCLNEQRHAAVQRCAPVWPQHGRYYM